MATGMIENWADIDVYGPIYPFVGSEVLLTILGLAFWVIWHIWQIKKEAAEFDDDQSKINQRGGIAPIIDEERDRELKDLTGG